MSDQVAQSPLRAAPQEARRLLVVFMVLAVAGAALGWNEGQLPRRVGCISAAQCTAGSSPPDLQLYSEVIAEVRSGRDYYDAAREKIPQFGFPIASPLNWRLPTYAWLLARLPDKFSIQVTLLVLAIVALGLAFAAQCSRRSIGHAALTTFLLFGVIRWTFDGEAYLAQEVWATVFILISLSAHALWSGAARWRFVAVAAGLAALFFRELGLPFCGVACLVAAWERRWWEAACWAGGITLFFGFFAWHMDQVQAQLRQLEAPVGAGLAQWLRFGGLDFVLLTTRMNGLLFAAPGWVLWLYLLASLVGLARRTDETSRVACLSALAYLTAFAIVGRPENFYWGLMFAPLLPWGAVDAPAALAQLWRAAAISSPSSRWSGTRSDRPGPVH